MRSFSPIVGIEGQEAPECLVLDVTGLEHLFHSEEHLARQIVQELSELRYSARVAVADTIGAAWAASHFLVADKRPVVVPPGGTEMLFDLPIEGLRLLPTTVGIFHQLGVDRIGQVIRLPRSGLKARFGQEVLKRCERRSKVVALRREVCVEP